MNSTSFPDQATIDGILFRRSSEKFSNDRWTRNYHIISDTSDNFPQAHEAKYFQLRLFPMSEIRKEINPEDAHSHIPNGCHYLVTISGFDTRGANIRWQLAFTEERKQLKWFEKLQEAKFYIDKLEETGHLKILRDLGMKMMDNISLKDYTIRFQRFRRCFTADIAITWISEQLNCSHSRAIQIGNMLININAIHHVLYEKIFWKGETLFQFSHKFRLETIGRREASLRFPADSNLISFIPGECKSACTELIEPIKDTSTKALNDHICELKLRNEEILELMTRQAKQIQYLKQFRSVLIVIILFLILIIIQYPLSKYHTYLNQLFRNSRITYNSYFLMVFICIFSLIAVITMISKCLKRHNKNSKKSKNNKNPSKQIHNKKSSTGNNSNNCDPAHSQDGRPNLLVVNELTNMSTTSPSDTTTVSNASSPLSKQSSTISATVTDHAASSPADPSPTVPSCRSPSSDAAAGKSPLPAVGPIVRMESKTSEPTMSSKSRRVIELQPSVSLEYEESLPPPCTWPTRPLLLRRSPAMVTAQDTKTRMELLQPLRFHGTEEAVCVIPVESECFIGKVFVVLNDFPDSPSEYFKNRHRKSVTVLQGQFKRRIPFDMIYTGQICPQPLKYVPPKWLVTVGLTLLQTLQPGLQADLHGERPYLLSHLIATSQNVVISKKGEEPSIVITKDGDVTEDMSILGAPFIDDRGQLLSAKRRKSHFTNRQNLKKYFYEPELVYTFDFYQHLFSFASFQLELGLFKVDVLKSLGHAPVQMMAVEWDAESLDKTTSSTIFEDTSVVYILEAWHERSVPAVLAKALPISIKDSSVRTLGSDTSQRSLLPNSISPKNKQMSSDESTPNTSSVSLDQILASVSSKSSQCSCSDQEEEDGGDVGVGVIHK